MSLATPIQLVTSDHAAFGKHWRAELHRSCLLELSSEQMTSGSKIRPLVVGIWLLFGWTCFLRKPIEGNGEEILTPFAEPRGGRSRIQPGCTQYQPLRKFCWVLAMQRLRTWYMSFSGHKCFIERGMELHSLQISTRTGAPGSTSRGLVLRKCEASNPMEVEASRSTSMISNKTSPESLIFQKTRIGRHHIVLVVTVVDRTPWSIIYR